MKNFTIALLLVLTAVMLAGCGSFGKGITDSANAKNLGLDGYVMYGKIETNNPDTGTPEGTLIIGRVTYKSRKVGIPADQKVPTTGYFKATATESLFGTKEVIIEYDFTAGSDADAKVAMQALEKKRREAEKLIKEAREQADQEVAPLSQGATSTPVVPTSAGK